ncbi:GNAT family N-acetyltransferase [Paroceanicella profunda]|uniref:GNAT family N-acetyltransferase n=1 Tax=Paroceanicella profunda TaxID=2579971 RepID=A0A5B8FYU3_9RHOB|nr:GNAT family N-acetyltransferase [Paroceanicella profunda]QDL91752.1 GNAT family N-acetyltransferase [Paroceanicella profunda]
MSAELFHPGAGEAAALGRLLDEVNAHYHIAPLGAAARRGQVERMLSGGHVEILMARDAEGPVGLAVYTFLDPAGAEGPALYMKELYVSPRARGSGLGRRMMARLADIATAKGCARMDWTTERWNEGALRFYAALGAELQEQKVYFRLGAPALAALAKG